MKFKLTSVLLAASFSICASAAANDTFQDLQKIQQAAQQYIQQTVHLGDDESVNIQIGHLDSRLHLPACKTPLDVSEPIQSKRHGARTLLVKCMDSKPWQIYLSAKVDIAKPILVAMNTIAKGEVISVEMLALEKTNVAKLAGGYFTDPNLIIGKTVTMTLMPGSPITAKVIASPTLIKRGQMVEIVAVGNGIEVHHKGQALSDGALGDMVSVKNLTSKRSLEGQVAASGIVKIQI